MKAFTKPEICPPMIDDSDDKQLSVDDLLQVHLESFEGPLDLLLDLIRKKKMDIQEISLSEICQPYLDYLNLMDEFNMEIAIEFIDIASTLILIKSRTLLPPNEEEEEEILETEEMLKQKLIEYQRYQEVASFLNEKELLGRDLFPRPANEEAEELLSQEERLLFKDLSIYTLLQAFHNVQKKASYLEPHEVTKEELSLEKRIELVISLLESGTTHTFRSLLSSSFLKEEVVVTFLAILELTKLTLIQIQQVEQFASIHCTAEQNIRSIDIN